MIVLKDVFGRLAPCHEVCLCVQGHSCPPAEFDKGCEAEEYAAFFFAFNPICKTHIAQQAPAVVRQTPFADTIHQHACFTVGIEKVPVVFTGRTREAQGCSHYGAGGSVFFDVKLEFQPERCIR